MTRLKVHHMTEGSVPQATIAERCGISQRSVERVLTEPPPTPPDIVAGERAEANRRKHRQNPSSGSPQAE